MTPTQIDTNNLFTRHLLRTLAATVRAQPDETAAEYVERFTAVTAAWAAFRPRDRAEQMINAQIVGAYYAALDCLNQAAKTENPAHADRHRRSYATMTRPMRYSMRLLARQQQRPADSAQPMLAIEPIPPPRRRPAELNATHDPMQSETHPAAPKKDRFMTAPSPGIVATTMLNQHYDTHEAYPMALPKALSHEYRAIRDTGPILQIDSPDLAMERHRFFERLDKAAFLRQLERHVVAINLGLEGIPRDRVRPHVCWGNNDGPHVYDIAMATILPAIYPANVGALSIEFADPRHRHEYDALRTNPLPAHMLPMPGVLDTTTHIVEHRELGATRLEEAMSLVGDRERVIAGTDCGFGTFAGRDYVAEEIVWVQRRRRRGRAHRLAPPLGPGLTIKSQKFALRRSLPKFRHESVPYRASFQPVGRTMARMSSLMHPGRVLREEYMEPLRLDAAALAHALGVSPDRIVPLIDDEAPLNSDLALRLARCFRTSPQFWLGLQSAYDLATARMRFGAEIESSVMQLAA